MIGVPKVCPKSKANTGDDCNDAIKSVNPGATELCDDIDNGCSAGTDEGCDLDKDAWCTAGMVVVGSPKVCVNGSGDCNDAKPLVNPGVAKDTCATAGVDDNCDGQTDQADSDKCVAYFKDFDGDTFGTGTSSCTCDPDLASKFTATKGSDCNDTNAAINPGVANDKCSTAGVDDNCDGKTDLDGAAGCTQFWIDGDGDKFGSGNSKCLCEASPSTQFTALKDGDCDDTKGAVNPGMGETCNGVDDNCDMKVDPQDTSGCKDYFIDSDGDSYGALGSTAKCQCAPDLLTKYKALVAGDCNDVAAGVNPVATEACNAVDDNCNGKTDEENATGCKIFNEDIDRDKFGTTNSKCFCTAQVALSYDATNNTDCLDSDAKIFPGAKELCNGKDDDCSKTIDDNLTAADSTCNLKGVCAPAAKCNGATGWAACTYVGLPDYATPEADVDAAFCDAKDNNCDGVTDEGYIYTDVTTDKSIGETCTGVGTCKVACTANKKAAECSCKL